MGAGHTPGPWRVDDLSIDEQEIVGRPTWPCRRFGVQGEWSIARIECIEDHPLEAQANACLIAVAPELLDFVKHIAKQDPTFAKGHDKLLIAEARGLVAKATGAQL